jgi:hypothetical protein
MPFPSIGGGMARDWRMPAVRTSTLGSVGLPFCWVVFESTSTSGWHTPKDPSEKSIAALRACVLAVTATFIASPFQVHNGNVTSRVDSDGDGLAKLKVAWQTDLAAREGHSRRAMADSIVGEKDGMEDQGVGVEAGKNTATKAPSSPFTTC